MIIYCLSYAHDIMIWITRSSDLHSDNIITTTTTTTIFPDSCVVIVALIQWQGVKVWLYMLCLLATLRYFSVVSSNTVSSGKLQFSCVEGGKTRRWRLCLNMISVICQLKTRLLKSVRHLVQVGWHVTFVRRISSRLMALRHITCLCECRMLYILPKISV